MAGLRDANGNFKGPGNEHWKRHYQGIGTRLQNWRENEEREGYFQCKDCGYYWPTERECESWCGCCWNCWMRNAHPDEMRRLLAGPRAEPKKQETQEPMVRKAEKAQARAIVTNLGFKS